MHGEAQRQAHGRRDPCGEAAPEAPLQGVFLVGALSPQLPLSSGHWRMAIDAVVPERHRAANLAAWRRGAGAGADARGV